jgi:ribonuclease P protein component
VTRNLLKRRIRAALLAQGEGLDKGLWVVRLRAPFDKATFQSAASAALEKAAGIELAAALRQAVQPITRRRRTGPPDG